MIDVDETVDNARQALVDLEQYLVDLSEDPFEAKYKREVSKREKLEDRFKEVTIEQVKKISDLELKVARQGLEIGRLMRDKDSPEETPENKAGAK